MNKGELIANVARQTQLSQERVREVLNATTGTIAAALEKKNPVILLGFGRFTTVKRRTRMVNHPQTGERIKIGGKPVPVFRPALRLKKRIAARRWPGRPSLRQTCALATIEVTTRLTRT